MHPRYLSWNWLERLNRNRTHCDLSQLQQQQHGGRFQAMWTYRNIIANSSRAYWERHNAPGVCYEFDSDCTYVHLICILVCAKSNTLLSDLEADFISMFFLSKSANDWLLTLQKFIIWLHWLKDEWTYYALKHHVKALARQDSGLISSLPDKRQHGRETGQRQQQQQQGGGGGNERVER